MKIYIIFIHISGSKILMSTEISNRFQIGVTDTNKNELEMLRKVM